MPLTTVIQGMLADNSVTTLSISAENVRETDIALSAIRAKHIKDYEIQTIHLSSNVVTTRNIANSAVTTRHYAPSSIQNSHLSAFCVDTANIATSAVTYSKLNFETINILYGSKVFHNTNPSLTLTSSNYLTAHGAIIVNKCTSESNITFDDSLPSNFHCRIFNIALDKLILGGSITRYLKFDTRKLSPNPGVNNTCILTGGYSDGLTTRQWLPMVYVFIAQQNTNPSDISEYIYVIPSS